MFFPTLALFVLSEPIRMPVEEFAAFHLSVQEVLVAVSTDLDGYVAFLKLRRHLLAPVVPFDAAPALVVGRDDQCVEPYLAHPLRELDQVLGVVRVSFLHVQLADREHGAARVCRWQCVLH